MPCGTAVDAIRVDLRPTTSLLLRHGRNLDFDGGRVIAADTSGNIDHIGRFHLGRYRIDDRLYRVADSHAVEDTFSGSGNHHEITVFVKRQGGNEDGTADTQGLKHVFADAIPTISHVVGNDTVDRGLGVQRERPVGTNAVGNGHARRQGILACDGQRNPLFEGTVRRIAIDGRQGGSIFDLDRHRVRSGNGRFQPQFAVVLRRHIVSGCHRGRNIPVDGIIAGHSAADKSLQFHLSAHADGLVAVTLQAADDHVLQTGIHDGHLDIGLRLATCRIDSGHGKDGSSRQRRGERTAVGTGKGGQGRIPDIGVSGGSALRLGVKRGGGILDHHRIVAGHDMQGRVDLDFDAVGIDGLRGANVTGHFQNRFQYAAIAQILLAELENPQVLRQEDTVQVPGVTVAGLGSVKTVFEYGFVVAYRQGAGNVHVHRTDIGIDRHLERQGIQGVATARNRCRRRHHGTIQAAVHDGSNRRYMQGSGAVHVQGCRNIAPRLSVVGRNLPIVRIRGSLVAGHFHSEVRAVALANRRRVGRTLARNIGAFHHIHLYVGLCTATIGVHRRESIGNAAGGHRFGHGIGRQRGRRPSILHAIRPTGGHDTGKGHLRATNHRGVGNRLHDRHGTNRHMNRIAAQEVASLAILPGIERGHGIDAVAIGGVGKDERVARTFLDTVHVPFDDRSMRQSAHNGGEAQFLAFAHGIVRQYGEDETGMGGRIHVKVKRVAACRIVLAVEQAQVIPHESFHIGVIAVLDIVVRISARSRTCGHQDTVDIPIVTDVACGDAGRQTNHIDGKVDRLALAYGTGCGRQVQAYRSISALAFHNQCIGTHGRVTETVGNHTPYHGIAVYQHIGIVEHAVGAYLPAVHEPSVTQVIVTVIERIAYRGRRHGSHRQCLDPATLRIRGGGGNDRFRLEDLVFGDTTQEIAVMVIFHMTFHTADREQIALLVASDRRISDFPTVFVDIEQPAFTTAVGRQIETERLVPQTAGVAGIFEADNHGSLVSTDHVIERGIGLYRVDGIDALPSVGGQVDRTILPGHRIGFHFTAGIGRQAQTGIETVGFHVMQLERIGNLAGTAMERDDQVGVAGNGTYGQLAHVRHTDTAVQADAVGHRQADAVDFSAAKSQAVGREVERRPMDMDTHRIGHGRTFLQRVSLCHVRVLTHTGLDNQARIAFGRGQRVLFSVRTRGIYPARIEVVPSILRVRRIYVAAVHDLGQNQLGLLFTAQTNHGIVVGKSDMLLGQYVHRQHCIDRTTANHALDDYMYRSGGIVTPRVTVARTAVRPYRIMVAVQAGNTERGIFARTHRHRTDDRIFYLHAAVDPGIRTHPQL